MSITLLPKLRSSFIGASALLIICSAAHSEPAYTFKDTPGDHLDVCRNGIPLVRYQYAYNNSSPEKLQETYKPIFHVMNQKGTAPITKGAGGDFTHHRGWFIGWMKITTPSGTVDRWHMKGGSIIHQKFLSQKADDKSATFTAALNWEGTTTEPILSEERTYIVTEAPAPAYVQVEMRSKLKALTGETKLDGDPEHAGFQFRPANEVDRASTVYVFPKSDADPKKDRDYAWVAEKFALEGIRYNVAFLNHPENPTDTQFSAYRDYGRFGGFFKTVIPEGGAFEIKGKLLVSEGKELSAEVIQTAANAFSGKAEKTPAITERPADVAPPKKTDPAKKTETPNAPAPAAK